MKQISRKTKSKIRYYFAWTVLIAIESIVSTVPIVLLGLAVVPLAKSTRSYDCLGGEIFLLCFAYWAVFTKIHHYVYDKIFDTKEGK